MSLANAPDKSVTQFTLKITPAKADTPLLVFPPLPVAKNLDTGVLTTPATASHAPDNTNASDNTNALEDINASDDINASEIKMPDDNASGDSKTPETVADVVASIRSRKRREFNELMLNADIKPLAVIVKTGQALLLFISIALALLSIVAALHWIAPAPVVSADSPCVPLFAATGEGWYSKSQAQVAAYNTKMNLMALERNNYDAFNMSRRLSADSCLTVWPNELLTGRLFQQSYDLSSLELNLRYHLIQNPDAHALCAIHLETVPICACMLRTFNRPFEMMYNMNITGFQLSKGMHEEGSTFCADVKKWIERFMGVWIEWVAEDGVKYTRFFEDLPAMTLQQVWENNHGITICSDYSIQKIVTAVYSVMSVPQLLIDSVLKSIETSEDRGKVRNMALPRDAHDGEL